MNGFAGRLPVLHCFQWKQSFFCLLALWSVVSWAQETARPISLSLTDALRIAKERHASVLIANERIQQSLARLSQAQSVLWPQVTGNVSQTRQTRNLEAAGIQLPGRDPLVGPFNSFDGRLRLTQSLLDVSAIQRLAVAKAGSKVSIAESHKVQQDAMALIAAIYIEAQRKADSVELFRILLKRDEELLSLTKNRVELGIGSALEWVEAEASVADARHRLQIVIADAFERQLDLMAALGLSLHQSFHFTAESSSSKLLFLDKDNSETNISSHPDILMEIEKLQQSTKEKDSEAGEFLPKLSATADYGASGRDPSQTEETYAVGVQLTVPLFEGNLRLARMNEAESRVREAEVRLDDTKNHVEAKALSARQAVEEAALFVKASEAEWTVSEKQFLLAEQRLEKGMGSQFEIMDARARLAMAHDRKREAAANYQLAQVHFAHALGKIEDLIESH